MKFRTTEEITKSFISDGWNADTSFSELTLKEAQEKGYLFAVNGIKRGRKYFKMDATGDIYDDNGHIAMFNVNVVSKQKERTAHEKRT